MEFHKYNSIENTYKSSFMNKIVTNCPNNLQWVVTEKIHGANFSFYCNGTDVKVAKRTAFIEKGDSFFGFQIVYNQLFERVKNLYSLIVNYSNQATQKLNETKNNLQESERVETVESVESVESVIVYGELFGGHYPHKDVPSVSQSKPVQPGVWYSNQIQFIAFDIAYTTKSGIKYLGFKEAEKCARMCGITFTKPLFIGPFANALNFSKKTYENPTSIPMLYKLPKIKDNVREGNVIKPIRNLIFTTGERVIVKHKNNRFSEKKTKVSNFELNPELYLTDSDIQNYLTEAERYITVQRLDNARSKIGDSPEFVPLRNAFKKDMITEFLGDHPELESKKNKGSLLSQVNVKVNEFVKSRMGII